MSQQEKIQLLKEVGFFFVTSSSLLFPFLFLYFYVHIYPSYLVDQLVKPNL